MGSSETRSRPASAYAAAEACGAPALIADGDHARVDGYVSLSVVASAFLVWIGWHIADTLIGIAITLAILKVTWDSWHVISATQPGEEPSHR